MRGKTSFQSAMSGEGEQFLLLDCRARARAKVHILGDTGAGLTSHHGMWPGPPKVTAVAAPLLFGLAGLHGAEG